MVSIKPMDFQYLDFLNVRLTYMSIYRELPMVKKEIDLSTLSFSSKENIWMLFTPFLVCES